MAQPLTCPKCSSPMQRGFTPDLSHRTSTLFWTEGDPEESFWAAGVKLDPDKLIPVTTYRCTRCGYLESYARQ